MERLLLICIFLIFRIYATVEENQTLIYHWDVHHEMNYYCQFGTDEQIRTHHNFEIQCFRKNKGMRYVSSDGVKFYPYLAYGSPIGFVLNCTDIPGGDLHSCSKYIYSSCNYSCKGSKVTREIQCVLKGPQDNVRAQWSISEPCTNNLSDPIQENLQKNSNHGQSQPRQVPTNMDVQYTTSNQEKPEDNKSLVIACSVAATAVVILAIIGIIVYRRKYRRKPGILRKDSDQNQSQPGQLSANMDVQYRNMSNQDSPLEERVLMLTPAKVSPSPQGGGETASHQAEMSFKDQNGTNHRGTSPVNGQIEINNGKEVIDGLAEVDATQRSGTGTVKYPDGYEMAILQENYNLPLLDPSGDNYKNMQDFLKSGTDSSLSKVMKEWASPQGNLDIADLQSLVPREEEISGNQRSGDSPSYNQCISTVKLLNSQTNSYRRWLAMTLEANSSRSREQTLINIIEQHKEEFGFRSLEEIKYIEQRCGAGEMIPNIFLQRLSELGVKLGRIVERLYACSNFKAVDLILEVHRDCPFCEKFRR